MKLASTISVIAFLLATPAWAAEMVTYTYDVHGRLIRVIHTGTVNPNLQTDYTYDKADNRVTVKTINAPN